MKKRPPSGMGGLVYSTNRATTTASNPSTLAPQQQDLRICLLEAFEEDRAVRRDDNGEPVPRQKRRKSNYDLALARQLIQVC